jgi:hypothetical protein
MKINFISYNNGYGLTKDMEILQNTLKENFKNIDILICDFYDHKIRDADINIFFEIISNILIPKAKYNILIPNQEWFYKNWIPYLENIDLILTKSKYGEKIFQKLGNTRYLGWESQDLCNNNKKNFKEFIHSCGKSSYKQTQFIIDNWLESYPKLTILYHKSKINLKCHDKENITYIHEKLEQNDLIQILNEKGIHLCCSETEGYGHYINEARSCKSVVITTDSAPMNEFIINNDFLIDVDKKLDINECLGERNILSKKSFHYTIEKILKMDNNVLIKEGENNRNNFLKDKKDFQQNTKEIFSSIFSKIETYKKNENEFDLPKISIVTVTKNRPKFIKLCLLNIFQSDYPLNKIEWVVIDDSENSIKELLPKNDFIKYFYYNENIKIGRKRNLGVEKCLNDYILFMDDDDYYPSESFKERITNMIKHNKNCVYCSSIGCFHINKYISIMNVPPHQLPYYERVSEATLCFKKTFWERKKFEDNSSGAEGNYFIRDRYSECLEIPPEKIIVSLLHSSNTSHKDLVIKEPNGCHFNFSDTLFSFITNIDQNKEKEKKILI